MGHKLGIGAIFGIVSEEGVAKPASPVTLLDRENHRVVARQMTRSDGGFTFNGLNQEEATYIAYATDEDGEVPKNALIQDRILPVPAYSGATYWNNWLYSAIQRAMFCGWAGHVAPNPANDNALIPQAFPSVYNDDADNVAGNVAFTSGSVTVNEYPAGQFPGAPHLPTFTLANGRAAFMLPPYPWELYSAGGRLRAHSFEFTADLRNAAGEFTFGFAVSTTTWGGRHPCVLCTATGNNGNQPAPIISISYNPTERRIRLRYGATSSTFGPVTATNWSGGVSGGSDLVNYDYVFPSAEDVPEGMVHIAYSIDPGVEVKVFVNGVVIASSDLSAQPTAFAHFSDSWSGRSGYARWSQSAIFIAGARGGTSVPPNITQLTLGPFAFYPYRMLSEAEVLDHYESLFEPDVMPKLTGYAKDVFVDSPFLYLRLNDTTADVEDRSLCQANMINEAVVASFPIAAGRLAARFQQQNAALVTEEESSPVVGGMSTRFHGGYLRATGLAHGLSNLRQLALDFFIKPDAAAPGESQRLFHVRYFDTEHKDLLTVDMSTTRTLSFTVRLSTDVNETFSFAHELPTADFSHVGLVLDKVAGEAYLYVDGVLEETVSATTTSLWVAPYNTPAGLKTDLRVSIAGSVTGTNVFAGHLCEFAVYPYALPTSRVLAHYNARLIP